MFLLTHPKILIIYTKKKSEIERREREIERMSILFTF